MFSGSLVDSLGLLFVLMVKHVSRTCNEQKKKCTSILVVANCVAQTYIVSFLVLPLWKQIPGNFCVSVYALPTC